MAVLKCRGVVGSRRIGVCDCGDVIIFDSITESQRDGRPINNNRINRDDGSINGWTIDADFERRWCDQRRQRIAETIIEVLSTLVAGIKGLVVGENNSAILCCCRTQECGRRSRNFREIEVAINTKGKNIISFWILQCQRIVGCRWIAVAERNRLIITNRLRQCKGEIFIVYSDRRDFIATNSILKPQMGNRELIDRRQ